MYENGKIYRIVGNVQNSKCYIGSTVQPLSKRMGGHRGDYKRFQDRLKTKTMSFDLFDEYGIENCSIILIENYPCETKEELLKRERYWIETTECVNKIVPTRTIQEYQQENKEKIKEYQKKYQKENKEILKEYRKEYRQENKEILKEYEKEYRHNNKSVIADKKKEYYEQNREHINEKIHCECGGSYKRQHKSIHEKSKKHQNFTDLE